MSIMAKLAPQIGAKKSRKRVGRGDGSGHGGTSGKGHKGQKSRSSPHIRVGFEGGQMPLHRRSPKWGFTKPNLVEFNILNLSDLERFPDGTDVNPSVCLQKGFVKGQGRPLKILGGGKLSKKLTVRAHAFSASAKSAIEAAKGSVEVLKKVAGTASK